MYLVAGGVLDRNPKARCAFIESGASWLAALAERMDEVHTAHANFVHPKLSIPPSAIIDRQVWASFQHDRSCIAARNLPGGRNVMWGSDYPHAEGTFPISRQIVVKLFDGLNVPDSEKANILGLNAAQLFRIDPVVSTAG
jgi:predicted TIM-barrel fold metal-dependent hydrolase